MGRVSVRWLRAVVCGFACVVASLAQAGEPASPAGAPDFLPDLQQITARAGLIFLGRVDQVEWKHAPGGGRGDRVRVTFHVLDGIRGARTGEKVEIEEWSGLWIPGGERYHPGETLFLFYYPRSRLGLTSPVGGDSGRIEITPTQRVVLSPERTAALLPRSLRLQKHQAVADALRSQRSAAYVQFAAIVRELARLSETQVSP